MRRSSFRKLYLHLLHLFVLLYLDFFSFWGHNLWTLHCLHLSPCTLSWSSAIACVQLHSSLHLLQVIFAFIHAANDDDNTDDY